MTGGAASQARPFEPGNGNEATRPTVGDRRHVHGTAETKTTQLKVLAFVIGK